MKKIHPAFILFILLYLFFGRLYLVVAFLFALSIHEFAHAFVAHKLGYKLKNLSLMPYGACLMYQDIFTNDDELYIALAGPFASFLTALIISSLWWIFPVTIFYTTHFFLFNLGLGFFNLIPAFPLDGSRILICLLEKKMARKKAFSITVIFNYAFSGVFLLGFIFSLFSVINLNFLIIAVFLVLGVVDTRFQAKYINAQNFSKSKHLKKGIRATNYVFSSDVKILQMLKKISLSKYTVFSVVFPNGQTKFVGEDLLKKICENFNHNLSFDDIYFFFDK